MEATDELFQPKNMSSSVKIRVPAEEYVIYFTLTDQSNYRITLDCGITIIIVHCHTSGPVHNVLSHYNSSQHLCDHIISPGHHHGYARDYS